MLLSTRAPDPFAKEHVRIGRSRLAEVDILLVLHFVYGLDIPGRQGRARAAIAVSTLLVQVPRDVLVAHSQVLILFFRRL
jgi:hypothetical protein